MALHSANLRRISFDCSASLRCLTRTLFSPSIKKFYKNVSIAQLTGSGPSGVTYEVQLDQRKLRTPGGKPFLVPHEMLALAVAQEWDSQKDTIKRHSMHLTALCNRVLDFQADVQPQALVSGIMQYADTDTICFRCTEPDDLVELQKKSWDPVLDWVVKRFKVQPMITNGLIGTVTMSEEDRNVINRHFLTYNRWGLIGLQYCVENLKSVFLTLAMVDGFCSSVRAVELSQLELLFQVGRWGEVLSHHDVQTVELNSRVSAGLLFVLISHQQREVRNKMGLNELKNMAG
ncbi:ATP synthase mitochondrial F1 complex assembly factor [Fasciola gigantica]|uniref:ATP synthase mitochondrial F1 complex assembly factor n=1 Tax=Fasciola gigantica TaxID=46835 RepID=A0A504YKS0_FASGI|nr:ATP synthase mitochondrial F1 complex assembly factor [Fasciola gigantica]